MTAGAVGGGGWVERVDELLRAGALTPAAVAEAVGCGRVAAGWAILAHGGWPWPGRGRLDPRPDLADDSVLWERLFASALAAEPELARSLWVARRLGGKLVPHPKGGCRLARGDGWKRPERYDAFKRRRLDPRAGVLIGWLRDLEPAGGESRAPGGAPPPGGQAALFGSGFVQNPSNPGDEYRGSCSPGKPAYGQNTPFGGLARAGRVSLDAVEWRMIRGREGLESVCAAARDAGICGIDTETAPRPGSETLPDPWRGRAALDPRLGRIRLLQIAVPGRPVALMDLAPWWDDPAALADVLRPMVGLLADPGTVKAGHNLKFDLKMLRAALGGRPLDVQSLFDVMLAAQLLACGLWPGGKRPFSLEEVACRELGVELDKTEQRSDWSGPLSDAQLLYAAYDAAVLLPLHSPLAGKLASEGLERAAALEFECVPATADMEYAGMGFDRTAWAELADEERAALAVARERALSALAPRAQKDLFGGSGAALNLNSPQQVLRALRALGAEIEGTRDEVLQQLVRAGGPAGEAAAALLEYRKHAKALSAFIEPYETWAHPVTGRIHSEYRQLNRNGVGRFSAADPNIQQLPREARFRRAFVPARGKRFVIADYSAVEMRIMGWLSRDPVLVDVFRSCADPHRRTAALVMGKPEGQVTKNERQLAKSLNFGLIYGMSASGLQAYAQSSYGVTMTLEQAQTFRQRYFAAYRGVAAWHRRQDREARLARMVRTASGRARRWASSRMPLPELLNSPDQGTGADILKRAMARLRKRLNELDAALVASVHDELVVEAPAERAEEAAEAVRREMVAAGGEFIDPVPVEVEVAVGGSWAEKA